MGSLCSLSALAYWVISFDKKLLHQPSKHESSHLGTHLPIWTIQKSCPRLSEASKLTFILKVGQKRRSPEDSRSFESHRSFQSPMFSLKASRLSRRWVQRWLSQFLVVPWATPWRCAWRIFWRKGATGLFKGLKVTTATKPFEELVESVEICVFLMVQKLICF